MNLPIKAKEERLATVPFPTPSPRINEVLDFLSLMTFAFLRRQD